MGLRRRVGGLAAAVAAFAVLVPAPAHADTVTTGPSDVTMTSSSTTTSTDTATSSDTGTAPSTDTGTTSPAVPPSSSTGEPPAPTPTLNPAPSVASPPVSPSTPGSTAPGSSTPAKPAAPSAATPTTGTATSATSSSAPPLDPVGPPPGADAEMPTSAVSDALFERYAALQRAEAELRTALALERTATSRLSTTGMDVAEATIAAARAEAEATEARDVLTSFTREAYMEGSELSLYAGLAAVEPDELISVLASSAYLDRVTRYRIENALQKVQAADRANAALAAARAARAQAEAAVTAARARVATARAGVAAAQADYNAALITGVPPNITLGPDGCPTAGLPGVMRDGSELAGLTALCKASVAQAATPWAAAAIRWAFAHLGAPYACGGVGRDLPFRFDCSSLVSRAYHEGAGLPTSGVGWAPSTRDMLPWDGVKLAPHYYPLARAYVRPGDLALYDTGGTTYRHVVMVLANGYMLHTNRCGDVSHVARFWGLEDARFLGARRVLPARA